MFAKGKILVIDDDPDFLESVGIVLESRGYEVHTAESASEGLSEMRRLKPDLVLLDVMMSYALKGLNVTREIRSAPDLKETPLILISAIVSREERRLFPTDEYLHADLFMSKPISPDKLLSAIERLLALESPAGCEIADVGRIGDAVFPQCLSKPVFRTLKTR